MPSALKCLRKLGSGELEVGNQFKLYREFTVLGQFIHSFPADVMIIKTHSSVWELLKKKKRKKKDLLINDEEKL